VSYLVLASTALAALGLTALTRRLALNSSLLDVPNDRSSHTTPTPRGGGVGFVGAFYLAVLVDSYLLGGQLAGANGVAIVLLTLPLAVVGFLDDRGHVSAGVRYLIQLGVALGTIWHLGPAHVPWPEAFAPVQTYLSVGLAAFFLTALINFYNFMDGLDGILAGCVAVQLVAFAFLLKQPLWLLLAGAVLGFLPLNWHKARIFMGDVGSTLLGASVGIALATSQASVTALAPALALTLPITLDSGYTIFRRLLLRENIFKAHKKHIYQRLNQSGWSHGKVAGTYVGLNLVLVALASLLPALPATLGALGLCLACLVTAEVYLGKRGRSVSVDPPSGG
tara:strand:+ start:2149 stop:3159 length:1011 start_codon:yes stop_codon:yes gene_type:complete